MSCSGLFRVLEAEKLRSVDSVVASCLRVVDAFCRYLGGDFQDLDMDYSAMELTVEYDFPMRVCAEKAAKAIKTCLEELFGVEASYVVFEKNGLWILTLKIRFTGF